jgi:hypothetical protein
MYPNLFTKKPSNKNSLLWIIAAIIIPSAATYYVVAVYSPFFRPIWYDEFLQFAFGAFDNVFVAWKVMRITNEDINHGQTGILSLLQFCLMSFGAPIIYALRVPSVVATWLMFFGCMLTFKAAKVNTYWGILCVVFVTLQPFIGHYSSEARPYIFLCAGISLTLAYYVSSLSDRKKTPWKIVGYSGVIIGCLFHPYFPIYCFSIAASTFAWSLHENSKELALKDILFHFNLPVVATGAFTYFSIAMCTWLGIDPNLDLNPFQWINKDLYLSTVIDTSFGFVPNIKRFIYLYTLAILALIVLCLRRSFPYTRLVTPVLVILSSALAIFLLSWISFRSGYWILPRQWVGSLLLTPVGVIFLLAVFFEYPRKKMAKSKIRLIIPAILVIALLPTLLIDFLERPHKSINSRVEFANVTTLIKRLPQKELEWARMADENYPERKRAEMEAIAEQYVLYANSNISSGEGVNSAFKAFYCTVKSVRSNPDLMATCPK